VKRVLLISNAWAGAVSARAKDAIAEVLRSDFNVDVVDTTSRDHATALARAAVDQEFDAVLAFGGDGTVNEAAQSLAGSDVALGILPGGSTNVMARSLGIPRRPVEAAAFAASRLRSRRVRRINLGRINERLFLFSAGMGLDAEVVRRAENDPEGKRRRGPWLFLSQALEVAVTDYVGAQPVMTVEGGGRTHRALFVVCCNARPLTYFKGLAVDACPWARLDKGLDFLSFTQVRAATIPRLAWSLLVSRSHVRWQTVVYHHDVAAGWVRAERPVPVQVDGDYLGRYTAVAIHSVPNALSVLV
jgi:diacylglycerol kinase family enzyme